MACAKKRRCSRVREREKKDRKGERREDLWYCKQLCVVEEIFTLTVTNGGGWGRDGRRVGALEPDSLRGPNPSSATYQLCNFVQMTTSQASDPHLLMG